MTSFIIHSTDKQKRKMYINNFLAAEGIDRLDIAYLGIESSKNQGSIGIDEIKNLRVKIFLKPIKSEKKAIIIEDGDFLTDEAQNALLKVLEEPPHHTIIIISAESVEALLPTIISRCQVVALASEDINLSDGEKTEFEEFIKNLPEMRVGERLKKAEELSKSKEEAVAWIGKLILVLREQMLNQNSEAQPQGLKAIKSFQDLHTLLKTTNVNPRFAIENTLLSL